MIGDKTEKKPHDNVVGFKMGISRSTTWSKSFFQYIGLSVERKGSQYVLKKKVVRELESVATVLNIYVIFKK